MAVFRHAENYSDWWWLRSIRLLHGLTVAASVTMDDGLAGPLP